MHGGDIIEPEGISVKTKKKLGILCSIMFAYEKIGVHPAFT